MFSINNMPSSCPRIRPKRDACKMSQKRVTDKRGCGSTGKEGMAQAPDSTAVDQIYRAHSAFIWKVMRARGIPAASIPDVLHEIFLTVLRRLSTYEEQGSLKGWLYTIADGHIRQFFRGEGRRKRRMTSFARELVQGDALGDLDDHLRRSEATLLVQRFIDNLPEELREVFLLCCVEGLPGVVVAPLLRLNINTLYSREAAARRRFHAFIERVHATEERPT